jgi:hypothetical protein
MDRFGITVFTTGYLEKWGIWGKGDLEAGRTRTFFLGNIHL